jgi:hypothetical protein
MHHMPSPLAARLRVILDGPVGAVLGGAVYGAWATYVNAVLGLSAALLIGFTHFLMSAGITYASVNLMRCLFGFGSTPWGGFWIAFCGDLALTYAILVGVHLAIGTPHILWTLTPGFIPTIAFALFYATLLRRTMPVSTPVAAAA